MALQSFPECNESVASDAHTCPHCGHLLMLFEGRLTGLILLILGIFLVTGQFKLLSHSVKKIGYENGYL